MKNNKLFFASILIISVLVFALSISALAEVTPTPTATNQVTPSATATTTPDTSPSQEPSTSPSTSPSVSPSGSPSASPSGSPDSSPDSSPSVSPSVSPSATPNIVEQTPGRTQPPPEKTKDPYQSNTVTNAPPTIPPDAKEDIENIDIATPMPDTQSQQQKRAMSAQTMLIILFVVLFVLLALDIVAIYLRNNWVEAKKASFSRKVKDYYDFGDNEDTSPNEFDLPILEDEPQSQKNEQIDIFDGFDFTQNSNDENG